MLDQLKKDYPGISEDVLKQVAEEEGIAEPEPIEQEEVKEEVKEPEPEPEEQEETAEPPSEMGEEKTVPLKALHEERTKRKALSAQIEALKAEIDAMKNKPVQQEPVKQEPAQPDIAKQIKKYAKELAVQKLGIEGNPTDLMFSEPDKYEEYLTERAKVEYEETSKYNQRQQTYSENVNFINELKATQDFGAVYQFAMSELDEMPRKDARTIDEAFTRVDQGRGNQKDFEVLKTFANTCRDKMNNALKAPATPQTTKLSEMAKMPRASQLSGGSTSRGMSEAEIEALLDSGNYAAIPPEVFKKYSKG